MQPVNRDKQQGDATVSTAAGRKRVPNENPATDYPAMNRQGTTHSVAAPAMPGAAVDGGVADNGTMGNGVAAGHATDGSAMPENVSPHMEIWRQVRARLRGELGEAIFNSWFRQLSIGRVVNGQVYLQVPTRFIGSWIETHHLSRILSHWQNEDADIKRIEIEICPVSPTSAPTTRVQERTISAAPRHEVTSSWPGEPDERAPSALSARTRAEKRHNMPEIGAPLDPRNTFENFVIGKSNELAHLAARRIAESYRHEMDSAQAHPPRFNPLFLYGSVGLGKTHLMHAIGWQLRRTAPERQVLYISAEKFMFQFIRALRSKDMIAFKQQFREVDVLMVDDIQFIAGKGSTQEEFFHTFNALIDKNCQLIISADRSPSDLDGIEDRIRSRLGGGLVADIHQTDYELRLGILRAKAESLLQTTSNLQSVPIAVMEFLARRIVSNIRVLEGALNRVIAFASLTGRPMTVDMAGDVLQDLLRTADRRISIDEIQRKVADHYNIRMGDMLSARRSRMVARPRQIAMYIAKQLTTRSLPEIGRKFGGRDHTTVIYAVRKIETLRQSDPAIEEDVSFLLRTMESG